MYQFKARDLKKISLCLGNISKDFTDNNIKKQKKTKKKERD